MIEATAHAYGFPTSETGRLIFPDMHLGIPGVCAQPASSSATQSLPDLSKTLSDLTNQAVSGLEKLAGIPPCTKGTFLIGLRGTFEDGKDNLGGPVGKLATALKDLDPNGVTTYGVPYPANVGVNLGRGVVGQDPVTGYAQSLSTGAAELLAVLTAHLQCPGEKIVLAGYSQGAQAIRVALGLLPADTRAKISHVVLFGDPVNLPGGISEDDLKKSKVPTETYCHAGDPLCTSDMTHVFECITGQKKCPHFGYETEAEEAAKIVNGSKTSS